MALVFSHTTRTQHKWGTRIRHQARLRPLAICAPPLCSSFRSPFLPWLRLTRRGCVPWSSLHPLSVRLIRIIATQLCQRTVGIESKKETKSAYCRHQFHLLCTVFTLASRQDVVILDLLFPNFLGEQRPKRAERRGLLSRLQCPRGGMWSEARARPRASRPRGKRGPLRRCSPETLWRTRVPGRRREPAFAGWCRSQRCPRR